jgi:uncharacterized protein
MNAALPETVDVWRMVQTGRSFQGNLPLAAMPRLRGSLDKAEGSAQFEVDFGKDDIGISYLHLRAEAGLPLVCQRTLDPFVFPVRIDARLGLITREAEEAGLPAGYEPLLITDGNLHLADVIEDELILALPVVPVKPGAAPIEQTWGADAAPKAAKPNPFSVLQQMKATKK